jgi:hypothetical protein
MSNISNVRSLSTVPLATLALICMQLTQTNEAAFLFCYCNSKRNENEKKSPSKLRITNPFLSRVIF